MDSKRIVIISVCGKVDGYKADQPESFDVVTHKSLDEAFLYCKNEAASFLVSRLRGKALLVELEMLDSAYIENSEGMIRTIPTMVKYSDI